MRHRVECLDSQASRESILPGQIMKFNVDEVITWLIVGVLAGSLAGMLVKRSRAGFGHMVNMAIGLIGALIGGSLFKLLGINLGLAGNITISSEQIVAAFVGSLLFLAIIWEFGVRGERPNRAMDVERRSPGFFFKAGLLFICLIESRDFRQAIRTRRRVPSPGPGIGHPGRTDDFRCCDGC